LDGYYSLPASCSDLGPQFVVGDPLGNANYKAMQISVTKRTSHGLAVSG